MLACELALAGVRARTPERRTDRSATGLRPTRSRSAQTRPTRPLVFHRTPLPRSGPYAGQPPTTRELDSPAQR
ncbi:hypothetical protein [Streptomyces sp. NPDC058155]|uniref:hypothetical protein n=1 Tax=Streptomyces sp. NPDC058155 TaxID=3346359 RepID=UPI0036EAC53B